VLAERSSPTLPRWVLGEWLREIRDACDYRGALVTGLLQTPDYARAVLAGDVRAGPPRAGAVPPGGLERLLAVRLERQQLLREAADPLRLWAVMDEAAAAAISPRASGRIRAGGQRRGVRRGLSGPGVTG
jgi:hypothetical protein